MTIYYKYNYKVLFIYTIIGIVTILLRRQYGEA